MYEVSGSGAELFVVDRRSGVLAVAECAAPGTPPCLDYETRKDYFLQYKVGFSCSFVIIMMRIIKNIDFCYEVTSALDP